MLRNSDGGFGYAATDLAAIDERVNEFHATVCLYVVDARQSLHFRQVFRAAHKSIIADNAAILEHLAFGTINGTDGKPFKTRSGGAMRLSELLEMLVREAEGRLVEIGWKEDVDASERREIAQMVGVGALKYADLQHDRESDYIFDLKKFSRFEGRTGPYLQYTAVRIRSLQAKAAEAGLWRTDISVGSTSERTIAILLDRFSLALRKSCDQKKPHILAEHLYDLASSFNQFYGETKILTSPPDRAGSWLSLSDLVLAQLLLGLNLLGIQVPERM